MYNVAIYCRLSKEESSLHSINNQKSILTQYVKEHGWNIYDYYIDNGYSGTNFNRPSFKKMLQDINKGLINIVICKDLSRFGRNYLKVGYYLEKYFPKFNINFITINDHEHDFFVLKNIINEYYAHEVSYKTRSVIKEKMKIGAFKKTRIPLYGYKNDALTKRIIDKDIDKNIQDIFSLYIKGFNFQEICVYLKEHKVLNPLSYYLKDVDNENKYNWSTKRIIEILNNKEYLGHYIRGKTSKEEYLFKNVFEPIIQEDIFCSAYYLLNTNKTSISLNSLEFIAIKDALTIIKSYILNNENDINLKQEFIHDFYQEINNYKTILNNKYASLIKFEDELNSQKNNLDETIFLKLKNKYQKNKTKLLIKLNDLDKIDVSYLFLGFTNLLKNLYLDDLKPVIITSLINKVESINNKVNIEFKYCNLSLNKLIHKEF